MQSESIKVRRRFGARKSRRACSILKFLWWLLRFEIIVAVIWASFPVFGLAHILEFNFRFRRINRGEMKSINNLSFIRMKMFKQANIITPITDNVPHRRALNPIRIRNLDSISLRTLNVANPSLNDDK